MFDFSDTETPEYKQHCMFVDVSTNRPKPIQNIDKTNFPYPIVDDPKEFTVFSKEQLLSKDECEYLVWLAETTQEWPSAPFSFWSERNIGLLTVLPRHMYASVATAKLVVSIHHKIKEFVSKSFGVECYADQIGIVRWPPGSFQMPHIDDVSGMSRVCGCVVYLNDDYEGGRTYYPYYGKENIPMTGKIFAHDSGHSHLHGVTKILGKTRYTIASTWSTDKNQSNYENDIKSLISYVNQCGQPELPYEV